MDTKHRYTATFEAVAQVISPDVQAKLISTASLAPLAKLLPAGIDPGDSPDMLYVSANGAVANLANRNGDSISGETALSIYKTSRHKYLNLEHNRDQIIGVILYPGLTRFESNEPLSESEASVLKEPFNMSFVGALWKVACPMVSKHVAQQGDSVGSNCISMSWEIAFSEWDIGLGSSNLFEAKVITADDPSFALYDKMLLQNGGKGKDAKGQDVYRIIKGDAVVLGFGLVLNPAAAVRGILPIEKLPETTSPAAASIALSDAQIDAIAESVIKKIQDSEAAQKAAAEAVLPLKTVVEPAAETTAATISLEKNDEKNRTPPCNGVTLDTPQSMKIESLEQLTSNWAEIRKNESCAHVADFVKAIKEGSDKYMADLKAQEDLLKNAELAKAANEKRAAELKASLDEVKKELAEVRTSQEALQSNQKFQERMASFDEKFDLDDEDRALLTKDIKDLDDDAFAAYSKKCDKLMAAKSKKAKKADKKADPDEDFGAAKAAKEEAIKAAVASIKEIGGQATLPNSVTIDEDLTAQMAAAFGSSMKINGQTIEERKAARKAAKK